MSHKTADLLSVICFTCSGILLVVKFIRVSILEQISLPMITFLIAVFFVAGWVFLIIGVHKEDDNVIIGVRKEEDDGG